MQIVTPPTVEPVTVTELARNLRLFTGDGDYAGAEVAVLQGVIQAARADAEHYTGRFFARQTVRRVLRDFMPLIPLHRDWLSVSTVQYYDADNQVQAIASEDYFLSPAGMVLLIGQYPAVYQRGDAVQVTFDVGQEHVPPTVKQAILLIASHWYENREATSPLQIRDVPLSYQWLLDSHREVAC